MKKVLIDLSILKHLNCGLGQVAYNYAKYYQKHAKELKNELNMEIHLLVPASYVGAFGPDVHYHRCNFVYRLCPSLLPKFDVWHSIHQLSRYNPPTRRFTKNVLTIHDLNFLYEKGPSAQERDLKKLGKKIDRADRIVCISQYSMNDVQSHFDIKCPIEKVYNGVQHISAEGESIPSSCLTKRADSSRKFLFTIGQVYPKKNFHVLLDAMKLLPDYDLYIAGKDTTEYAEMIKKRIREENISNVFLVGEVPHSEKLWFYHHCEAFIFPSLVEGFGLPIIEVMYFGKPVISSDKTSLSEIGGDHVFYLKSFEPTDMVETINHAVEVFYATPSMAEVNRKYAESFSYEKHLKRYIEIFRGI